MKNKVNNIINKQPLPHFLEANTSVLDKEDKKKN